MKKKNNQLLKRILLVVLANMILGLGIATLRLSGFGTRVFDTCFFS